MYIKHEVCESDIPHSTTQTHREIYTIMKGNTIFFLFCSLFLVSFLENTGAAQAGTNYGVYIVYMGAAVSTNGSLRDDHAQLMSSVLRR